MAMLQKKDFLNQQMIAQRITLKKHFDIDETTLINIDKNQIKQALLNIILNALDATPPGGIMTVGLCQESGHSESLL